MSCKLPLDFCALNFLLKKNERISTFKTLQKASELLNNYYYEKYVQVNESLLDDLCSKPKKWLGEIYCNRQLYYFCLFENHIEQNENEIRAIATGTSYEDLLDNLKCQNYETSKYFNFILCAFKKESKFEHKNSKISRLDKLEQDILEIKNLLKNK